MSEEKEMPYTNEKINKIVDPPTDGLVVEVLKFTPLEQAGIFNRIICRIAKAILQPKKYWKFALIIGTILLALLEIWRRLIVSYEDDAIKRNGDIF